MMNVDGSIYLGVALQNTRPWGNLSSTMGAAE